MAKVITPSWASTDNEAPITMPASLSQRPLNLIEGTLSARRTPSMLL